MSKLFESIKRGLQEAIAFAEGKTTGARVHQSPVTIEKQALQKREEDEESVDAPSSSSSLRGE